MHEFPQDGLQEQVRGRTKMTSKDDQSVLHQLNIFCILLIYMNSLIFSVLETNENGVKVP